LVGVQSPAPFAPTLAALLDTLIPADASPSATQLGVQHRLLGHAARRPALTRRLRQGCAWLDRAADQGAVRFADLEEAARIDLLLQAEGFGPQHPARRLMDEVLPLAMRLYYSDPRSWPSLGYHGPPQPRGFPDYSVPPTHGPD
jgi:hypothetical protein